MAEQAQRYIEEGLHDLLELVNRDLLTQEEARAIVQRRSDLEYKVARTNPLQRHFKAAINYEEALDRQLQERRADLGVKKKSGLDRICDS